MKEQLTQARAALWHLRKGGLKQLNSHLLRKKAEQGYYVPSNIKGVQGAWHGFGRNRRLSFQPIDVSEVAIRRPELRVGVILDDFSLMAFGSEWTQVPLSRGQWAAELEGLDLVFIESAWKGNSGQWQYQLTGDSGVKADFVQLLEAARERGIPTVFWNKEDPVHFDDFIEAAALFDFVFTTDSTRVADYKERLGHSNVGVLPFAAQDRIHNPARPAHGFHERGVAFGGMYFAHKYPERRAQMDFLLGGAADAAGHDAGTSFEIFSRQLGGEAQYQFPEGLKSHVVGSLSYAQMMSAYKAYKAFLNVNSVTESPSMCARRIFEISAAGTPVVTAPSAAIGEFFADDQIFVAHTREQASAQVGALLKNAELGNRAVHRAQRSIWAGHTYRHRVNTVLSAALPERIRPESAPRVSALVSTIRPQQLEHVLRSVASQERVDVELVLLAHGFEVDEKSFRAMARDVGLENVTLLKRPLTESLGACLNACVDAASGDVLTKMDDDDLYASQYLSDLLYAMEYSGAEIVGKQAHFMNFSDRGVTVLRNEHREHRFTNFVTGPTITARAEVFRGTPFEDLGRGEDTTFLNAASQQGARIYSTDKYNFCQMRHNEAHTWQVDSDQILSRGTVVAFGNAFEHITV